MHGSAKTANSETRPFSEEAWTLIAPIRKAVEDLPLLEELAAGSLSKDVFLNYIQQDALYLKEYARALAIVASKAPDSAQMMRFLDSSQRALQVEHGLHSGFLESFGLSFQDLESATASPSGFAYVNFIMATVQSSSYAIGLSAILPCFWIYYDVGERMKAMPKVAGNPYQAWIDTYGDENFADGARAVIALTIAAAASASPAERQKMLDVFRRASQYEWMFWQTASELESWRV